MLGSATSLEDAHGGGGWHENTAVIVSSALYCNSGAFRSPRMRGHLESSHIWHWFSLRIRTHPSAEYIMVQILGIILRILPISAKHISEISSRLLCMQMGIRQGTDAPHSQYLFGVQKMAYGVTHSNISVVVVDVVNRESAESGPRTNIACAILFSTSLN